jgi:hypothetical protein
VSPIRDRYPEDWLALPGLDDPRPLGGELSDFLTTAEINARWVLKSFGVDVARTYQFWEHAVARLTTGTTTSHRCPWDIELPFADETVRIEVKFSDETLVQFSQGDRWVFKFATPTGTGAEPKQSHVTVLIGIDANDRVHTWIVPSAALAHAPASITLTSPRARLGGPSRSDVEHFRSPLGQLLPEVLRAYRCHLRYDAEHHAETRAATRRAELDRQMNPLFPLEVS